ncbi:MAG: hypothetical protein R3314_00055 [Longimicrobiales bacterium]|nr:hypothetical protein [Longimicrobiales bacterium]
MNKTLLFSAFVLLGLTAGCEDLAVENITDPDRTAALSDAVAVQNLIAASWNSVWAVGQDQVGSAARIPGYSDEGTANHRNLIDFATEPRGLFPNSQVGNTGPLVEAPWYEAYAGAANAMDGLRAFYDNDISFPPDAGAATEAAANARAEAFAWLNHGILYGYLAMIFDQATLADVDTDFQNEAELAYRPYPEVQAFAMTSLQNAIDIATAAPAFETPASWAGGNPLTNAELVELAHSYMARLLVYTPRNPTERQAVDWTQVIQHVDAGIQSDFMVQMTTGGLNSAYFQYLMQILAQRWSADFRLLGPADTTGVFAAWVAASQDQMAPFDVQTADRRIAGAGGPQTPGLYFRWTDEAINVGSTDEYLHGRYKWERFAGTTFPWAEALNPVITVDEMNLLKAEALLRTSDPDGAATLINITREANGQLPPVTAAGVPGGLSSCIPRTQDGTACGTLMDALHHERLIEGMGLDVWLTWFDRRGFGTLQPGTFEQLPIPAEELESFGLQVYSFGGGGEYSADSDISVQ